MDKHTERIRCPQCKKAQEATVRHTEPWWTYVHHCEYCSYIILESEWERLPSEYPLTETEILKVMGCSCRREEFIEWCVALGFSQEDAEKLNGQIEELALNLESFTEGRTAGDEQNITTRHDCNR